MRTFFSSLAVIVGLLLAAVAGPAIWVDRNVVQEDGFVSLMAPLGDDADFQKQLAAATIANLDISDSLPGPLARIVEPILESAAQSLVGLPGYPAAWEETLRNSHRLNFPGDSSEATDSTAFRLDLGPLTGLVVKQITATTGLPLPAPGETLVTLDQSSQRETLDRISTYAPLGYQLAGGAVVIFLLAVVVARRRWAAVLGIGISALIVAGIWALGLGVARDAILGMAGGSSLQELFQRVAVETASSSFTPWITSALVAGGVLVVLSVVVRVVSGKKASAASGA
ncbi:hypothetical protein [Pseudarthrobacter sp. PS3-L1]|uniref:hypothetical protein n=1 Tax=Pseudarthrobacter sp. PS3-L1 TaxID=3046207 RepID=UPI0024BA86D9|nr:hypothetical protein [Pseudarthrobacter sp. PS3-L1]MDJ0321373.1 hypothetical protein [Pseudarthrobacter sp. PS3-L1]